MKKILFVEDDALITRVYAQKLAEANFELALAADGLEATKRLLEFKPDLVVLDLLMPKFNGPDVLRFMRRHPELKSTRVIVFTNSFLSHLVDQIAEMGVELTLVKASATPAQLITEIEKVLVAPIRAEAVAKARAGSNAATAPAATTGGTSSPKPGAAPAPAPETKRGMPADSEFGKRMAGQFHESVPAIFKELRKLCRDFVEAADAAKAAGRLPMLQRKLRFLTQMAGMAGHEGTAELSSALEALGF